MHAYLPSKKMFIVECSVIIMPGFFLEFVFVARAKMYSMYSESSGCFKGMSSGRPRRVPQRSKWRAAGKLENH